MECDEFSVTWFASTPIRLSLRSQTSIFSRLQVDCFGFCSAASQATVGARTLEQLVSGALRSHCPDLNVLTSGLKALSASRGKRRKLGGEGGDFFITPQRPAKGLWW